MTPELMEKAAKEIQAENERQAEIITDVRKRYPDVTFPDVYRSPLWYGRSGAIPIKGACAIIGSVGDKEHVYANAASDQYKIVTHEETLYQMERSLVGVDDFGKPKIKGVSMFDDGAQMCARVEFPECQLEIKGGKNVSPRVDTWNSYDLSKMYGLSWGAVEQVCTNGMVAYHMKSVITGKHRQNLDIRRDTAILAKGMMEFSGQVDEWKKWGSINLAPPEVTTFMEALPFGTRHSEKIMALPQTGSGVTVESMLKKGKVNLWELHSIITQFLTHDIESEMVRVKKGEEVAKAFHMYARN